MNYPLRGMPRDHLPREQLIVYQMYQRAHEHNLGHGARIPYIPRYYYF